MPRMINEAVHLQVLFCKPDLAGNLNKPSQRGGKQIDLYLAEQLASSLLRIETIQRTEALEIGELSLLQSSARHAPASVTLLHYRRKA